MCSKINKLFLLKNKVNTVIRPPCFFVNFLTDLSIGFYAKMSVKKVENLGLHFIRRELVAEDSKDSIQLECPCLVQEFA